MRLQSLPAKINLAILVTAALINVVAALILFPLEKTRYNDQLVRTRLLLETVYQQQRDDIANELFARQTRALWATIREMQEVEQIIGVTMFTADGDKLLSSNGELQLLVEKVMGGKALPDGFSTLRRDDLSLAVFTSSINVIGEPIGAITVFYDLSRLDSDVRRTVTLFVFLSLATLAVMTCLLNFFLFRSVIKPVSVLRSAMRRVEQGALGETVTLPGNDEITEMGRAFNDMSRQLANSQTALRQAEKMYRNIFEHSVEGIFQVSANGQHFLTVNPALAQMLGYASPEELTGQVFNIGNQLFAKHQDWETILQRVGAWGRVVGAESVLRHKNGGTISTNLSVRRVDDERGDLKCYEGSIADTTERKKKEEADQKRRAAELANMAKSEFLAKMSHEIRTPLNAILGFADILASSATDRQHRSYIETIRISGANLLQLINDILDISKIEAGRMDLSPAAINLRKLFADLERIFSVDCAQKKIALHLKVSDRVPQYLLLDIARIRQVLFNLIGNSVKFTDRGEVAVLADINQTEVTRKIMHLEISVRDTGIGMDEDELETIFDAFKQARGSSHRQPQGTGLGLAISKALVEMMGGTISVTSEVREGSLFTMVIPCLAAEEGDGQEPDLAIPFEDPLLIFMPATIVVADDLEMNRQLIKAALKDSPLTILDASDGRQAVDLAFEHQPELILMDIVMPDVDGYSALGELRTFPETRDIPVIAITAAGMKEDIEKILESGFDAHLIRPFNAFALQQVVAGFLPFARAGRQKVNNGRNGSGPRYLTAWQCSDEVAAVLRDQFQPRWERISRQQRMPDIQLFTTDLEALADQHQLPVLKQYCEALRECAEIFDIERLTMALGHWSLLLRAMSVERSGGQGEDG